MTLESIRMTLESLEYVIPKIPKEQVIHRNSKMALSSVTHRIVWKRFPAPGPSRSGLKRDNRVLAPMTLDSINNFVKFRSIQNFTLIGVISCGILSMSLSFFFLLFSGQQCFHRQIHAVRDENKINRYSRNFSFFHAFKYKYSIAFSYFCAQLSKNTERSHEKHIFYVFEMPAMVKTYYC